MKRNIGRSMSILHRQAQVFHTHSLKSFGISAGEYPFLLYLYTHDGCTQDDLVNALTIDKAATARAIASLEEKGYVSRGKVDADKRCNHIKLSDKAKENEDEIRRKVYAWSEFLSEDIDPETLKIVEETLNKMVEKVEKRKKETEID